MTTTYYEYAPAGDLIVTVGGKRYRKNDDGDWAYAETGEAVSIYSTAYMEILVINNHACAARQVETWKKRDEEARKASDNW